MYLLLYTTIWTTSIMIEFGWLKYLSLRTVFEAHCDRPLETTTLQENCSSYMHGQLKYITITGFTHHNLCTSRDILHGSDETHAYIYIHTYKWTATSKFSCLLSIFSFEITFISVCLFVKIIAKHKQIAKNPCTSPIMLPFF